jgi:hypothetical protein
MLAWRDGRIQLRPDDDVGDVHGRQHEAGNDARDVELADRHPCCQAVEDEHDRWRDQRRKAAAGTDAAQGKILLVAAGEHGGRATMPIVTTSAPSTPTMAGHQRAGDDHGDGQAARGRRRPRR